MVGKCYCQFTIHNSLITIPRDHRFRFDACQTAGSSAEAVDAVNGAADNKRDDSDAVLLKGQSLAAQDDVGKIRDKVVD